MTERIKKMANVVKDVYDVLKERTEAVNGKLAELSKVEAAIKSGDYSRQKVASEFYPKRDHLRSEVARAVEEAARDAKAVVTAYQNELRNLDTIDPERLTPDFQLLSSGIELAARDLNAMMHRNGNNETMLILVQRYAKAHNIELSAHYYGHEREAQDAENVNTAISLYTDHWMKTPDNLAMLDKFFLA
jgi:uncharacterized protein